MKNNIYERLERLEQMASRSLHDFEQFKTWWAGVDELSRVLFIFHAERPETWTGSERHYMTAMREHLNSMGLVDHSAKGALDIAAELDSGVW